MSKTEKYRNDHKELLNLVTDITSLINGGIEDNAGEISRLLSRMSGKLKIHLAVEDESLYPSLIDCGVPQVSDIAQRFKNEMGGLLKVYSEFASKYMTAPKIQNDASGFKSEFDNIVKALGDRITREENELYKVADENL